MSMLGDTLWELRPWLPMSRSERETRLLYWTSENEWYVELNGERIAILSDVQFEDMFWVSCRIKPLTKDETAVDAIYECKPNLKFVHTSTALVAGAFSSGKYLNADEM